MKNPKQFALLAAFAALLAACVSTDEAGYDSGRDAIVPGTAYHATGNIPASMGDGQPTTSVPFGVKREGKGTAVVTITKPDGRKRSIFFTSGRATSADTSQADWGAFSSSRQGDLTIVRIGAERYEIPDAVIYGG